MTPLYFYVKGEGIYEENENSSSANNGSKDASNVKGMFRMFYCSGVEFLDLSNWNLGNAEYLEDFFARADDPTVIYTALPKE